MEFTKEIYNSILADIELKDYERAVTNLKKLHPYDIAEFVKGIEDSDIPMLFDFFDDELSAEILSEMEDDTRKKFILTFKNHDVYKKFLAQMDSDDAADLINELPSDFKRSLTSFLRKNIKEDAADIISLLHYDEDSAGGLMAKELVRVNVNWSVQGCIDEIRRQADDVDSVYAVYVVDDKDMLMGLVPLSKLIVSKPSAAIEGFYQPNVISVQDTATADEVADLMDNYNLVALPVVDYLGKLVGRITIDDVVDYIREEAEEDYQLASGLSENVEYSDRVWVLSRARLPWLFLGLLGGIASSKVIGLYEGDLQIYPEMAFFIPLIAAMGGNAGVQSSAIVVQSLATKRIQDSSLFSKISKEFLVSLINALLCSTALLFYGSIANSSMNLSVTVSLALLVVIIFASVLGALIPMMLNKLKIDPALATGPFITTTNDLLGLGIYFYIGRLMYGLTF